MALLMVSLGSRSLITSTFLTTRFFCFKVKERRCAAPRFGLEETTDGEASTSIWTLAVSVVDSVAVEDGETDD